jgi:hypothetical protein
MLLRDNKCKSMTHNKTQITPSPEDEKFVTLQAEVTKLQHLIKSNPKKPPAIPKTHLKKALAEKTASVTKESTDSDHLVMKNNGKDCCCWCPKHHSWGRHQPQDCEGKGVQRPFKPEGDCKSKLAKAMPALEENESTRNREFLAKSGDLRPTRTAGLDPHCSSCSCPSCCLSSGRRFGPAWNTC